MSEIEAVFDIARDNGWWVARNHLHQFCDDHPVRWAADTGHHVDPPYLLVHDGDTGNHDDDGRVTFVSDGAPVGRPPLRLAIDNQKKVNQ